MDGRLATSTRARARPNLIGLAMPPTALIASCLLVLAPMARGLRVPGPQTTRVFGALDKRAISSVGGAGGTSRLDSLLALDAELQQLHEGEWPRLRDPFVRTVDEPLPAHGEAVDVAVCGGTLGILLACALQQLGHRVAVIEAGPLKGRQQDWNTSEDELRALCALGVLDESELAEVAPRRFGPMRCAFGPEPGFELSLSGVLDIAVSPEALLRRVRARFEAAGGVVLERTRVGGVFVHPDGARLSLSAAGADDSDLTLRCRLLVDCMGHRSPIALQQRGGQRPDGVCVQVGCCASAEGFAQWGERGDFFCTADAAAAAGPNGRARVQHFWQAFPTSGPPLERTVYMFTYLRPGPEMPGLVDTLEAFWERLPAYQRLDSARAPASGADEPGGGSADTLAQLNVSRVVYGWFPTYRRNAPLAPAFDRVLSVGDASAVQSPLSFGGFCAMLRHLPRLRRGIDLALRADALGQADLRRMTPYLPNLASAWMSSAAMTARAYDRPAEPSTIVNALLEGNFKVMDQLPRAQAVVFFRDVTTLQTLLAVLLGQTLTMAPLLPAVVAELGLAELAEFSVHLGMLALYTAAAALLVPPDASEHHARTGPRPAAAGLQDHGISAGEPTVAVSLKAFRRSCRRDAWLYGSGLK